MNHQDLIAQIRFQLSTLRERNEHHSFEHLCRQFARIRICTNIIPATGPVAVGGDQGRDFETFRTYLHTEVRGTSTFVGAGSTKEAIAFACTTQLYSSGLPAKILEDVAKITQSGAVVDSIYFFCTEPIPIAKQHELRDKVRNEHAVELWIIDREALSEQLADPDTFHIASEYLSISADLYPKPLSVVAGQWYQDVKMEWSDAERIPATYRDFSDLKRAIREASHDEQLYPDVPFWVGKLRMMITGHHPVKLKLQAIYEVAVGLLLSQKDMTSETENLSHYFDSIVKIPDEDIPTDLLNDASVLLTFSSVAVDVHHVGLSRSQVTEWHHALLDKTDRILNQTSSANLRCDLLQAKAQLFVVESFEKGEYPGDKAFDTWLELADAVESAPLFPLERFADFITKSVPYLGDHPSFRELSHKVDALLENRVGSRAAAEKCRDRAMAFSRSGQTLAAIAELHDAKVKWYSRETIVPSLLSIMSISSYYEDLGLMYAAKQYALATASLAYWSDVPEAKKFVSSAVSQVAVLDYQLGNWSSIAQTAELAATAHVEYVGDFSEDRGDRVEAGLQVSAFVLAAMEHVGLRLPDGETFELPVLDQLGRPEYQAEAAKAFTKKGLDGLREMAAGDLYGFPFGDLHKSVETVWVALGIKWHAVWSNDFETIIAAEHLLSSLQVLLADLAHHDLHTLQSDIHMTIKRGSASRPELSRTVHDISGPWVITLPERANEDDRTVGIDDNLVALCFEMVRRISVLPDDELMAIMEQSFKHGVSSKLFVAKSYSELFREFRNEEDVTALPRIIDEPGRGSLAFPKERPEMSAATGLSPLYSVEAAHQAIRNRYLDVQEEFPVTLARLNTNTTFRETLSILRQKGWKDWHILQAIANVFLNFHTRDWIRMNMHPAEIGRRVGALRQDPAALAQLESTNPIPLDEFTADRLEMMLHMSIGATMKGLGLVLYDECVELSAIIKFMGERFNFWEDDVDHTDPFAPPPPEVILPHRHL